MFIVSISRLRNTSPPADAAMHLHLERYLGINFHGGEISNRIATFTCKITSIVASVSGCSIFHFKSHYDESEDKGTAVEWCPFLNKSECITRIRLLLVRILLRESRQYLHRMIFSDAVLCGDRLWAAFFI